MKQPERERAEQVVLDLDWRATRWLGVVGALVVVLGLGIWLGLSASQINPSVFDPYASSASPGEVPAAAQPAPEAPVLLPLARRDFKPEPEEFAVKGDPEAPITIVEYSDYQ